MKNPKLLSSAVLLVVATFMINPERLHAEGPPISGAMQNFVANSNPQIASQKSFQNIRGQARTFADLRGKVILVNFWATWCSGSKKEIPTLQKLQNTLGGAKFDVVLMSQDAQGWKAVTKFVKRRRVNIPESYLDVDLRLGNDLKLPRQMGSILIDKRGREVGRLIGHADWDTAEARALIQYYIDQAPGSGDS